MNSEDDEVCLTDCSAHMRHASNAIDWTMVSSALSRRSLGLPPNAETAKQGAEESDSSD
jgi:hypothetical protein